MFFSPFLSFPFFFILPFFSGKQHSVLFYPLSQGLGSDDQWLLGHYWVTRFTYCVFIASVLNNQEEDGNTKDFSLCLPYSLSLSLSLSLSHYIFILFTCPFLLDPSERSSCLPSYSPCYIIICLRFFLIDLFPPPLKFTFSHQPLQTFTLFTKLSQQWITCIIGLFHDLTSTSFF